MLPDDAVKWIEATVGGTVRDVRQQARWRPQYFISIDRPDGPLELLARGARRPRATLQSKHEKHFDLAREARIVAALQGHGLRIPKFYGYNDEHELMLMERLEGTNFLAEAADDDERRAVMKEYFEQLAKLHGIDPQAMAAIDDTPPPATPEAIAFESKFSYSKAFYDSVKPGLTPDPLLELGLWWLYSHVPDADRPLSFIQGDTGPGQFMFADGHLTGLIDWELAHIGDPMLDLGVIRMRNMLYPTGSLREPLAHYEAVSGRTLDRAALSFYTVFAMLLTPIGVVSSVQKPSVEFEDMVARFGFHATIRRGLCDALAELLGIEIEPPALPEPEDDGTVGFEDFLVAYLDRNCLPIAREERERMHMGHAAAIARLLQREKRIGAQLREADLDDMAAVLGERPATVEDGLATLDRLVAERPAENLVALVRMFGRIERRREHLWAPLMVSQEAAPFERLY